MDKIGDYWQYNKSAIECHGYMFEHSIATDVTFTVEHPDGYESKDGRRNSVLSAHKYMLMSRSPVFMAMFTWPDTPAKDNEILIDDADPDAFYQVLRYIYTDKIELEPHLVMHVWYIAKKYLIASLDATCVHYLEHRVTPGNAALIYDQCLIYDEKRLAQKCLQIVTLQTKECLQASSFVDIHSRTLEAVLDLEDITCNEIELFRASLQWAGARCEEQGLSPTGDNIKCILGSLIDKIRFPTMAMQDFNYDVISSGILSKEEVNTILSYMDTGCVMIEPQLQYSCEDRCYKSGTKVELVSDRMENTVEIPGPHAEYKLEVELDCSVYIHELLLYDSNVPYENQAPAGNDCLEVSLVLNGAEIFSNHNNKADTSLAKNIKSIPLYGMELKAGSHTLVIRHIWKGKCFHCRAFAKCGSTLGAQFCFSCGNYSGLRPTPMKVARMSTLILENNFITMTLRNIQKNKMPIVGITFSDPHSV